MIVIKRNGKEVEYDASKIANAVNGAVNDVYGNTASDVLGNHVADILTSKYRQLTRAMGVESIQDDVETTLMNLHEFEVAKAYIKYRYERELARKGTVLSEKVKSIVDSTNEEVIQENSNKNPHINSTQRDYIAGEISKQITMSELLPKEIVDAHNAGIIHFHDSDYYIQREINCCLVNLDDMLQNGTMISGTLIERPHSFSTACNVTTQFIAQVASNQYGGQSISLSALAPFVDVSRQKIRKEVEEEQKLFHNSVNGGDLIEFSDSARRAVEEIVEQRLRKEITKGIQTIQYQVITLMTTNGQAPFITVFMYLDEVPEGQLRDDLALLIEETLIQRHQGIKNENGAYITTAFPKLIYCLDEDNISEDSKYWYLTKLAAKCSAKRLVPDYISAKKMRELKLSKGEEPGQGDVYTCMGAAAGYERVSIKIENTEYENIRIDEAIHLIRKYSSHIDKPEPDRRYSHLNNVCGVYKLTHVPTGLYYIGSSKNIGRRVTEHRYTLRHNEALGDNYYIGDDDVFNLNVEILEECNLDVLTLRESEWYNKLNSEMCVNHKDPICNGNFDSVNRMKALNHERYSEFSNKSWNWYKRLSGGAVLVKSGERYVPVRSIIVNSSECPLKVYRVCYEDSGGNLKSVTITEDHPLHTRRGRVECMNLNLEDELLADDMKTYYAIYSIQLEEAQPTYDFETDTDTFNLSGLLSHNCRSFLTPDRSVEMVGPDEEFEVDWKEF